MLTTQEAAKLKRELDQEDSTIAVMFSALGDRSRFRIFKLLMDHTDLCVTDIAMVLGITVPAASQQLKLLEGSGLIEPEREGQMICYRIRALDPVVRTVMRTVAQLASG
ncbi:hypothetical protein CL628_01675 [bacterium]|nr:hypothetical protein [bacterium]|tara:strand:- start:84 stop:410 length:327 start_codon:yes stop_codon:yes gene_type:complete